METHDRGQALEMLAEMLDPCFDDEPTAGTVVLLVRDDGTLDMLSMNLKSEEIAQALYAATTYAHRCVATHEGPETVQ